MLQLRIKEICKERGITLNELAERVGMSRVSLSGIVTGKQKPSFDTLEKLADALNIAPSELFTPQPTNTITCPKCGTVLEVKERI
ncbi:MAG TPA: helix-turn-helix transcriptional regulator [Candidatus Alistipes merdigallinarum]|nr:helix-turn-helix transcriptional regulator [Candidatus Alistipes merdigallinarum]